MKVTVKKVDALRREIHLEVPRERVAQRMEEVYQNIGKVAKVKGFRPGKAPRHVIEAEHGALAREEILKKIIPEVYQEAIKQENIAPIDLPEIHDVKFQDGGVSFVAHVDIRPEVKIDRYKGVSVKRKSSEVTEEELNKTLEYFQKSQDEGKQVTIDDAFARGLGYPSLDAFKDSLRRQMAMDKDRHNRADIENQVVEALLKEAKLAVPQSLVKRQLEHRMEESHQYLKKQGLSEEEIHKRDDEMRKNLQPVVERDVKVFLVFDKIAQLENIQVNESENLASKVMEFLLKEAKWEE